ncbi:NAD(P)H-dependent flavin oxidoreductase [Paraburkholderia sediminicola]|uniref:NAD(P)H-dependent flavin oxidoreductase n=1 Tax=Paraburkholderia sediminicola TaxID=458836 RepID=UPI0038BC58DB
MFKSGTTQQERTTLKTRITDLLGIRYPIIQGGMQWVGRAELASAVSNAGGLGLLTALTQPSPDALVQEIKRCRTMTDKPFGVNLTILPSVTAPPYADYLDAVIESGVKVIETAGNSPKDFIEKLKRNDVKVVHKCTSVRHALSAERNGVDAVSIDGFDCAGHPGEDDVPGLVLIPLAARSLKIPVVASGGIANGYGMAAAFALGAEGVNMGTRFCATVEAPLHDSIKQALVGASECDTQLIFRSLGNTGRVLKNAVSNEVVATERRPGGCEFDDIRHLVSGRRGRDALQSGEINAGLVWAGQVVGMIDDIPTCETLLARIVAECRERLAMASSFAVAL